MKNWFKITMLAALAAPLACSEVEVDEAPLKVVSFNVGTYSPQTRAEGDPVSVIYPNGIEAFSCRAYLHAQGFTGTAQESTDFFSPAPTTISWNSDTKEWLPPHDYYWPKGQDSYIDFISWYGGKNPTISYSKTGGTYGATFSWNLTEPLATTENLMWADVAWRYKANAQEYKFDGVKEGVPTLFHHALAQVYFQARLSKVSDGDVSWEVKVTDFKLTKVRKTGSFSLKISDPGTNKTSAWEPGTGTEIGWTELSGAGEISASITDPITLLYDADKMILGWSSVLPQDLDATGNEVGISITYTVTTKYGTTVKTVEEPVPAVNALLKEFKTGTGENDYIKKWECNKRYTYTIIIDPDTGVIKLIPVETNWEDPVSFDLTV